MSDDKEPIHLGNAPRLSPEQEKGYRERIQSAQSSRLSSVKGVEPIGSIPQPQAQLFVGQGRQQARTQAENALTGMSGGIQGVAPRPPGAGLRAETQQQLQDMATHTQKEEQRGETRQAINKEEVQKEAASDDFLMEFLDSSQRSEADRVLRNPKRRKDIESRCQEMSLDALLYKGEVEQKVIVVPGRFEPVLRSLQWEENLFLAKYVPMKLQKLGEDEKLRLIPDDYARDFRWFCLLTCSLVSITGTQDLIEHRNSTGKVDIAAFEAKQKQILQNSLYVVVDLGIQYEWFDVRARKLLVAEDVKNG
jgi:hypothetical protein